MLCIGIYQKSSNDLAKVLCSALSACDFDIIFCGNRLIDIPNNDKNIPVAVIAGKNLDFVNTPADICIIESGYDGTIRLPSASIAVVPECCDIEKVNALEPKSVVSYGLCCKNTVTVSSLIDSSLVISVQREIVTLSGTRIVEQEFSVEIRSTDRVDAVLAVVSALLIADVPIEQIKQIQFYN